MIEFDRLDKLRERRLAGLGTGNTQTLPTTLSDSKTVEKLREERLMRLSSVAETEFAQKAEGEKKKTPLAEPSKDASWWDKTKEFLKKYPNPVEYAKDYFKPTEEVRVRDFVREVPGAVAGVAKEIARTPVTVPTKVLTTLTGQKQYTPETELEKFLVGDEPVTSYTEDQRKITEFAQEKGIGRAGAIGIGLAGATAEVGLDLVTGGKGKTLKPVLDSVAKTLAEPRGIYSIPEKQRLFVEVLEPKIRQLGEVKPDERVVFFQGDGKKGQYVNTNPSEIWGYNVDDSLQVRKVKESELVSTGDELRDEVGYRLLKSDLTQQAAEKQKLFQSIDAAKPMTPEAKDVIDKGIKNAIRKDKELQERANMAIDISRSDGSVKSNMQTWLRNTYKGRVDAQKASLDLRIKEDPNNIFKHERGEDYEGRDLVVKKFDELFEQAEKSGMKLEKRANYIPHVYNQTPEEIKEAVAKAMEAKGIDKATINDYLIGNGLDTELARSLKMQPFFTQERAFSTYEEAAKWGLTPKYDTMKQLVAHYVEKMSDVVANKKLIEDLVESKKLSSQPKSGLVGVNIPGNEGLYFAEPKIASYLNDVFRNEDGLNIQQKIFKAGAQFSGGLQNLVLAGGLPKTNINFFTMGHVIKSLTSGVGNVATLNARGALKDFKALTNLVRSNFTTPSINWFNKRVNNGIMGKMANEGIDMSHVVGNYKENNRGLINFFKKTESKKQLLAEGYDRVLSEKTFNSFLPMQTVSMFEDTYKAGIAKGLSETEASALAGKATKQFMGLLDNLRGKSTEDVLGTVFFAPRFREGLIKTYWNSLKSLAPKNWMDPSFAQNRRLLIGMGLTFFGGYDYVNKKLNGHHIWENPPGKKMELMIPGEGGKVYYVPFMPSQLAFFRNIVESGAAAVGGDTKTAIQKAGSNFSMGVHLITDLLANKDYFGNEIYDSQAPGTEQIGSVAKYLGQNANHPYVKGVWNLILNANAQRQPIYPTYERITKLVDAGKREEANRQIALLSPEEKDAYYEMKQAKLKPLSQVLSEMMELPIRFTTQGKIEAAKYYEKLDTMTREIKAVPDGPERTEKIQEFVSAAPESERRGILNTLREAEVDTTGVSISSDIIKMKPTYKKVQELLAQGKEKEARAIVDKLSDEDYKAYKKVRSAAISAKTKQEKLEMQPTFDRIQELIAAGRESEAQKMVDEMTDRQYEVYKLLKDE